MTLGAFQSLGDADELLATRESTWAYPEFAQVTPVLATATSTRNAVVQSSAPTFRRKQVVWSLAEPSVVALLRGYAEDKSLQVYVENDGTQRDVVVMDFDAPVMFADVVEVHATLLEMTDPVSGS